MKHLFFSAILFSIICTSCNNADTKKDDNKGNATANTTSEQGNKPVEPTVKNTPAPPDSATMMKNWQNYMAVTDMQKMMATWNGDWDSDITMWEQPGTPPQKSKGHTTNKMILGGRYQISTHSAIMMGMPFEGQSTLGYDNAKKIFVCSWVDNMGTGILSMKGPWNASTKTMTLTGSMLDPSTGMDTNIRQTLTLVDDKTQLMQMYVNGADGKEYKSMEIKYTRK
ncbi:MAG: DUF1579 domain-containing protein [Bacteroidetes bacterium]|nr:DUF1579 domain-containing protein [Bacteroidota bacterium]MBS1756933.1 DUF1579 domain-containing protein [Bacteroidota bacterium]